MKFDEKAIRNTEICTKQANFNQNKHKNKQPASLQKNPQIHKKTSPNSRKTARLATLVCLQRQVAKLSCRLFYCLTLLRNNNMSANLHVFSLRFAACQR